MRLEEKIKKIEELNEAISNIDNLDEAVKLYEEASLLALDISKDLKEIDGKVTKIKGNIEEIFLEEEDE